MDRTMRSALATALLAAFLLFAAMIYDNYKIETEGDEIYSKAAEEFVITRPIATNPTSEPSEPSGSTVPPASAAPGTETHTESATQESAAQTTKPAETRPVITDAESVEVDFEQLKKINPEVVGWIIVENTTISYPVLQAENNEKYLTLTYNNKNNKYGSIFVDYRLKNDFSGRHTLIYGHNMRNSSMFGTLPKFTSQSYWQGRRYFHILVPGGILKYEIFAAYKADVGSDSFTVSFRDAEHYAEVLGKMIERSEISTGIVPTVNDKIVTLCTCTSSADERDTKRYVVHGRLISNSLDEASAQGG